MSKKMIPLGELTDRMEIILRYMCHKHGLQRHEIVGMVNSYCETHLPESIEIYKDNTELRLKWEFIKKVD